MADVVQMPDEAALRQLVTADPLFVTRLRADVERASSTASVAARFVWNDLSARFRAEERSLPAMDHQSPGSKKWTIAAVAHAQHLLESLVCYQALCDDGGSTVDARGMSRKGAAALLKAMQARFARAEIERKKARLTAAAR